MDKFVLLTIWLIAGLLLICGLVIIHIRRGVPLKLHVKGLGVEIDVRSGRDDESTEIVSGGKDV